MKKCPWCGKEFTDEQTLCSTDGNELRGWPEKKPSAGSNVSLPLAIRRKQPFFESLTDQLIREQHPALTITNEGISYNRVAKAVSFKWQEIDFIRYVTRSKNFLTIEAGLEVFPAGQWRAAAWMSWVWSASTRKFLRLLNGRTPCRPSASGRADTDASQSDPCQRFHWRFGSTGSYLPT